MSGLTHISAILPAVVPAQTEEYALARIEAAEQALAEAEGVPNVKDIRDKAEAIRLYLKQQSGSLKAQNRAAALKLRAERKLGNITAEMPKAQGSRTDLTSFQPEKKLDALSDLGITPVSAHRWQTIAAVPEPVFEEYIEKAEEITSAAVYQMGRNATQDAANVTTNEHKPEPATGKHRCIVIDPPWPVKKIERLERPNQAAALDYPTMTLEQIAALPVQDLADPDGCHLYLWVTQKYLPIGLALLDGWGFTYQCLMTWVKPTGMTPYSWMYNTEHVLFAKRGGLKLERLGLKLSFDAPVVRHSQKPDVFFDDDAEKNTDLIVFTLGAIRVACRIRRFNQYEKYGEQFTIRADRPSGAKCEFEKLLEGWGDYFFYGFSNEAEDGLHAWFIADLKPFRTFVNKHLIRNGGKLPGVKLPNRDDSSQFYAYWIHQLPASFIVARKSVPIFEFAEVR